MLKSGLTKLSPRSTDYSLLHTYGAIAPDPASLPDSFSIYDGRAIPNQNQADTRFPFSIPPLPMGCTGEAGAFETGIQDGVVYNPQDLYLATAPGDPYSGRDLRAMLQTLINRGVKDAQGNLSPKRLAYFNCYGSGAIDDFDAARIGLYINQTEKRGVYIGSYWYWGATPPTPDLYVPSYNTADGTLHCYLATGWQLRDGEPKLEVIPWVGEDPGDKGKFYLTRDEYNSLMKQPWTGAYTITKTTSVTPISIGAQAYVDHLVYWIRNLFNV